MAFKTDTIKLKLYTGSDPSGDNGELAIVDNTLRLKTGGLWADISGGSGGGGISELIEDTSPQLGGTLDANGNDINMGVNTITDDKVADWDTTFTIVDTNSGNWDIAYSWGDHASAGYLTSQTSHTDVLVDGEFASAGLMTTDGAGNYTITTNNSTNWDTTFGWGDHSTAGYLTSETSHADVVVDGDFTSQGLMKRGASAGSYSIITDSSTNWNTAYGWGDHSTQGYTVSASYLNTQTKTGSQTLWVPYELNLQRGTLINTGDVSGINVWLKNTEYYENSDHNDLILEVINASTHTMTIANNPAELEVWDADLPQFGLTAQSSFTLQSYQKALIKSAGYLSYHWDVVILSV